MGELVSISYSPWSEKARWALDHHRVAYRAVEYVPMLSEAWLRVRLRRPLGRVTVPVFFDRGVALTDSYEIARFADLQRTGDTLFPSYNRGDVDPWNDLSDRVMSVGRALATRRVGGNAAAAEESLPAPQVLRPYLRPVASVGVQFLTRKYRLDRKSEYGFRDDMRTALGELRQALDGGKRHILGSFSYADIAMAASLQLIGPVEDRYIRLGPHTRTCMTDSELTAEFDDLFAWRDWLYSEFR